jgi:hypothetical protein
MPRVEEKYQYAAVAPDGRFLNMNGLARSDEPERGWLSGLGDAETAMDRAMREARNLGIFMDRTIIKRRVTVIYHDAEDHQ